MKKLKTDRHTDTRSHRYTDTQTERQTNRRTDKKTEPDRQKERELRFHLPYLQRTDLVKEHKEASNRQTDRERA